MTVKMNSHKMRCRHSYRARAPYVAPAGLYPRIALALYHHNRQIDFVKIEGDLREMKGSLA